MAEQIGTWLVDFAKRLGLGAIRLERTAESNVTTAWGVNWDEGMIARDLLQNFFDANRNDIEAVKVAVEGGGCVTVTAPASFPLESLFYLGSTKGSEDVGQYGEGFKAAAMCLLRDHKVTPVVVSGDRLVQISVSDEPVAEIGLYCLIYRYYSVAVPVKGTVLALPGCPPRLIHALQGGMSNFFYPTNPLLGEQVWQDWQGRFTLYRSADERGHVFYTNLKRGEIVGIPAVIVIHKAYADIEKKIAKDRDRNAFGDELLDLFYKTFAERGLAGESRAVRHVLSLSKGLWERGSGHPFLGRVAAVCTRPEMRKPSVDLFEDRFYAESRMTADMAEQLRRREVEEAWKREGRTHLPGYFTNFGVPSSQTYLEDLAEKAKAEVRSRASRFPSSAERHSLEILRQAVAELSPVVDVLLSNKACKYTVAETEVVLGELKKGRSYNSLDVFIAASAFENDFADALALFLHEHAHVFGYDGSRGFTDALTGLLATVIRCRNRIDELEKAWMAARDLVVHERATGVRGAPELETLASMPEADLRVLLRRIPPIVLKNALTDHQK